MWQRRLAMNFASQLPDEPDDARQVWAITWDLLKYRDTKNVLQFNQPIKGRWTPKLMAAGLLATFFVGWMIPPPYTLEGTAGADSKAVAKTVTISPDHIRMGEPLTITVQATHGPNCSGIVHRVIRHEGWQVTSRDDQYGPREVAGVADHAVTKAIRLPVTLDPGEYTYEGRTDYICEGGRRENAYVPPTPFWIDP